MFYNTTQEQGTELNDYQLKGLKQEDAIKELFSIYPKLTPTGAWSRYIALTGKNNTPLTSIRRCISDLTKDGYLVQTGEKSEGLYGRNEFVWRKFLGFSLETKKIFDEAEKNQ